MPQPVTPGISTFSLQIQIVHQEKFIVNIVVGGKVCVSIIGKRRLLNSHIVYETWACARENFITANPINVILFVFHVKEHIMQARLGKERR